MAAARAAARRPNTAHGPDVSTTPPPDGQYNMTATPPSASASHQSVTAPTGSGNCCNPKMLKIALHPRAAMSGAGFIASPTTARTAHDMRRRCPARRVVSGSADAAFAAAGVRLASTERAASSVSRMTIVAAAAWWHARSIDPTIALSGSATNPRVKTLCWMSSTLRCDGGSHLNHAGR